MVIKTPVVTILGHVDHGKTTLLDVIRGSDVASGEAGGITQKVGAFQIDFKGKKITFIDTPGHEAFNKMRSRGASAADIAVLVVAANDGVQPQTNESIAHIKSAEIPFIVAITKIDMPNISIEKVKKQLSISGVQVEGYGGDIVVIPVSAKSKIGLDELLDMILLIWEMKTGEESAVSSKQKAVKKNKKQGNTACPPLATPSGVGRREAQKSKKSTEKIKNEKIAASVPSALPRNDKEGGENNSIFVETQHVASHDDNRFIIIESYLDNKKGSVIHAIIKSGSLKIDDKIFIEGAPGKIRTLINDKGQHLNQVNEGDPVEILGFDKVPAVGSVGLDEYTNTRIHEDKVKAEREKIKAEKEKEIKSVESVKSVPRESEDLISENLYPSKPEGRSGAEVDLAENPEVPIEKVVERKKLAVILKCDNEGSLEAIRASLPPEINLLLTGTGAISESDILLAKTTKAFVVGFNVEVPASSQKLAQTEEVSYKTYKIIYEMLTELQEVADSINEVTATEKIIGRAEIVQDFLGTKSRIAGCKVREGKFMVGDKVRVERGEKVVGVAKIESIKSFKKDVQKIVSGEECGIVFKPEVDFRLADMIISARPIGLKK